MEETGSKNIGEDERSSDRAVMEFESEETIVKHGISDIPCSNEIKNAENVSSHENLSPQIVSNSYGILTVNFIIACLKVLWIL